MPPGVNPNVLRRMRLLKDLSSTELAVVAKTLRTRTFKKGESVIQERAAGSSIFLVKNGEFKVSHMVRGKSRELGTFREGDHFGEVSFIDKKPRSAGICATEDSEILMISRSAFEKILQNTPRLQIKLMQALLEDLCKKLRERHNSLDFDLSDLLPVSIFETDRRGNITFTNQSGLKSFGYGPQHFQKGLNAFKMLIPDQREPRPPGFQQIWNGIQECSAVRKDRTTFPALVHSEPILKGAKPSGVRMTVVDITERKKMEQALRKAKDKLEERVQERTAELRESEERYAISARGANDGLWDWNLLTNEMYTSPRWKSMLGLGETEIGNNVEECMSRIHPEDLEQVKTAIAAHREGLIPQLETEHRLLHKDGTYRWVLCRGIAVRNPAGKACRMAGSLTDITKRKHMEQELARNAFYDSLTGLPNRALFMDRLGIAIERSKQHARRRHNYLIAVLYLDLDRFKNVNDSLGHALGDKLLIGVARRLNASVRSMDTVARFGGDEFVILLDEVSDPNEPTRVAGRILSALSLPFTLHGREVFVTASIGIAVSETRTRNAATCDRPEELLRDADTAMYRAKAQGKARCEIFDNAMHARAVAALQLETDLRWAIDREEYRIHYQPIVSVATGKIIGFEALIRWQHPERGLVMPGEFISMAEDTGLIVPIGQMVLQEACRQVHKWNNQYTAHAPLFVSVNVSGKQLAQSDFIHQIEQTLSETSLDPRRLKLEITESVMMENIESTAALLFRLKSMGVELSLDDFGTGYSSLSSLRRFPIDTLKIDCSFIKDMSANKENLHVVRTIIALGQNLEMTVLAEGVEERTHLTQLRELKCDYAQGYHFSRPVDPKVAGTMIASHPQW